LYVQWSVLCSFVSRYLLLCFDGHYCFQCSLIRHRTQRTKRSLQKRTMCM